MAAPHQKSVNLLVREGFHNTTTGQILAWALSAGRTVVIITELIVICAFLSRFWFDRQLTDLTEQNKTKKAQVEASLPFATDFKSAQDRIAAYKSLSANQLKGSEVIKTIAALLPSDVILSEIFVNNNSLKISGNALTEAGLSQILKTLGASGKFEKINLEQISLTNAGKTINFTVQANIKH